MALCVAMKLVYICFALGRAVPARSSRFVVKLNKQRVPVVVNNRTLLHKTAYFGDVFVGLPKPQRFTVVFDTGSGHFFLPSTNCETEQCLLHKRYNRSLSESAVDVNHDGSIPGRDRDQVSITYGTGEVVGEFAREVACIGTAAGAEVPINAPIADLPMHCTRLRVITASEMSANPFRLFEFDGVIGLGLDALALDPEFHFFGELVKNDRGVEPVFAVFLGKGDEEESEITFGGHDESRLKGPLMWTPVLEPEQGYWRIGIRSVKVGGTPLDLCESGHCSAILDTGTSLLGVPKPALRSLFTQTTREVAGPTTKDSIDCRNVPGPPLVFDLGGFEISLDAEGYSRPAAMELPTNNSVIICQPLLLPVDMMDSRVFLFGEPLLQKYYTAYDPRFQRVAFAPAQHIEEAEAPLANDQKMDIAA